MNGKSVLGMIFANIHEEALDSLTAMRTMGSVPFCSRFRLIDFPLSNLVESGVTKIGVVTNANFRSLMDHIGTGKPWDLRRATAFSCSLRFRQEAQAFGEIVSTPYSAI